MDRQLKQAALQVPGRLGGPAFGGITFRPTADIDRRCGICRPSVAAFDAPEPVPVGPVALVDQVATRAFTARVARIDGKQRHARSFCLVGQEGPQLGKRPTVVRAALRPSNRCPLADMGQVLDPNTTAGVFGLLHDFLADPMIEVGGEPRLFASALPQQTLGRFGSFLLQFAPQPDMTATEIGVMGAAEGFAIAIGGDVLPAEIDTEIALRIANRHVADVYGYIEGEHALP